MSEQPQKSGSPVLGGRFLKEKAAEGEATFTSHGAVNKTGVLALIMILGGALAWGDAAQFMPLMLPLVLGAFVLAMIVSFVPTTAVFLAPLYALLEGMALGALSSVYEGFYHGIVFQAALGTSLVLLVMIAGYATGLFRFGQRGRAVIGAAMMGIMLVYVADWVLGFFGRNVGLIQSNGPLGIVFSVVVLVVAAFTLSLNFDFIRYSEEQGLSKRMEWYAGFGVLVTMVWIYIEMLRLLSKLNRK